MGIPNKLSPLTGGRSILPNGYLAAEFLETHQPVAIGVPVNKPLAGYCIEQCHAYSSDVTGGEAAVMSGTNLRVQIGQWTQKNLFVWVFRSQASGSYLPDTKKIIKVDVAADGAKVYLDDAFLFEQQGEVGGTVKSFNLFSRQSTEVFAGKKYWVKMKHNGELIRDLVPCISPDGKPAFYDKVSKTHFAANDTSGYIAGLTLAQARNLSKLPTGGGTLTVSLPWEVQWDVGVQNALSVATTNGWTITVQYRDPEIAKTNIPISFLESTGTQYVMTGYMPTIDFGAKVIFSQDEPQTQELAVGGVNRPYFVMPRYYSNSRIVGGWGLNGAIFLTNRPYDAGKHTSALNYKNSRLLEFDDTDKYSFTTEWVEGTGSLSLFAYNENNNMRFMGGMRIYDAVFTMQASVIGHYIPVLDVQGAPCMYDCSTKQLFPNSGTGSFIAGFNTVEQALKLATLPDVAAETNAAKKSLTVSLPWEAQLVITGVPAALQVAADRGWTITVQYRDPEADNIYYNKYAECTKKADMEAVNANYKADLTADGKWIYPLPKLADGNYVFSSVKISEIAIEELPLVSSGYFMFSGNKVIKRFTTRMPKMNWFDRTFHDTSLEVFDYDGEEFRPGSLQLGFNSCENFRTFNAVLGKKIANANLAFSECILDKPSILRIANSAIPSSSGITFTIGMHIDLQNDTEVLDALATMEANGWVVVPQWNGTATTQTASTFGLKRKPVYAKIVEIDGEQYLDWGHYATNWEENGYQEFASLEEAKEYFNINQTEEV